MMGWIGLVLLIGCCVYTPEPTWSAATRTQRVRTIWCLIIGLAGLVMMVTALY